MWSPPLWEEQSAGVKVGGWWWAVPVDEGVLVHGQPGCARGCDQSHGLLGGRYGDQEGSRADGSLLTMLAHVTVDELIYLPASLRLELDPLSSLSLLIDMDVGGRCAPCAVPGLLAVCPVGTGRRWDGPPPLEDA